MNNLPIELVGRIMAYLPILDVARVELNYEIIKSFYFRKWCNTYKGKTEFSLDEKDDDYYMNWLENDIIFILNKNAPLICGIGDDLSRLIRLVSGGSSREEELISPFLKSKSPVIVSKLVELLTIKQIKKLDIDLSAYENTLETGHSNALTVFYNI